MSPVGRVLFFGPCFALALSLCIITVGCTKNGSTQSNTASQSVGTTIGDLTIDFKSEPNPPKAGDNAIEVTVKGQEDAPVTDATVTAVFSMPAMPSMNMPAMRSSTTLSHEGGGRYRGTGQLSMAGTWNVSVTVTRGSEELGTRNLSVVAK